MAKRPFEDTKKQTHGVAENFLNQVSHLDNVSIVPVTVENATKVTEEVPVDSVSIRPLAIAKKHESKNTQDFNIIKTDDLPKSSEAVDESTIDPENSVCKSCLNDECNCTLDYMDSVYCKKSEKYLDQSDLQEKLIQYGNNLKVLKLGSFFDSRLLVVIREHCPNIEKLELELKRYTTTHLKNAFIKMKNLKSVVVKNLDDDFLNEFADNLPDNIEEITMSMETQETWFEHSLSSFHKFNALRVFQLSYYDLSDEEAHTVLRHHQKTLVKLSLRHCKVYNGFDFVSNLKNLVSLDLGYLISTEHDGEKIIEYLTRSAQNLRYLDMSGYVDITGRGIMQLSKLKNLEVLIINDIDCAIYEINEVISLLNNLKRFECRKCYDLIDKGIISLLNNSDKIEFLNLEKTQVTNQCIRLANEVIKSRKNNLGITIKIDSYKTEGLRYFKGHPNLNVIKIERD